MKEELNELTQNTEPIEENQESQNTQETTLEHQEPEVQETQPEQENTETQPEISEPVTEEPQVITAEEIHEQKTEFDWHLYEHEEQEYSTDERKVLEEKYTRTLSVIEEMELIHATVVNITEKDVVLNIGFKSDGMVPLSEFKFYPNLKIGDKVEVMVESIEGRDGQLMLSHKKAIAEKAWMTIAEAHENGEIVKGFIKDRTKGGMVVDLFGLDAFLPGSQLDIKPVQDYDMYVGKEIDLKVVKLNPAFRNIVVSHKAIIEQDLIDQRHKILSKLEKGQVLEGIVKNLANFGVFVDLGGVDGLIHITDVSWGRISHPNQLLEIGDKINVVVLNYEEDTNRISLGMKQLTPHPWETIPDDIVESSVLDGKVVNIEDYGAFIEIFPGVEGLVHVSEMTWSQHLKSPAEYVRLNQDIKVKVLSIDRQERKLSLGIKQLTEDPWSRISEKYPVESKHNAVVKNITNFGLFVELEEGIDGLVHISDLSWTKKFNHPSEFAKVGDEMELIVLEVDEENRRLSLGHKQLEEDPWDTFKDIFAIESVHEGTIQKIDDKGATIILPYNIEGFCPIRHFSKEDNQKIEVDEVLEFKVIEFDKPNRKIVLSHSQIWREQQKLAEESDKVAKKKQADKTRKAISQVRSKIQKTTLATELEILQELKDKMEADEKKPAKGKSSAKKEKSEDEITDGTNTSTEE